MSPLVVETCPLKLGRLEQLRVYSHLPEGIYIYIFLKDFIYFIFLERVREGERGRETSICGCLLHSPNLARNPGMCPDWESNQQTFGLQAHAQSTELHQPGPEGIF